jgi:hypothetical protein
MGLKVVDGKVVSDNKELDTPMSKNNALDSGKSKEELKPSDIKAGEMKPVSEHLTDGTNLNEKLSDGTRPNIDSPKSDSNDNHPKENYSAIGTRKAVIENHFIARKPLMMQKIEKVLRDKGMDSMSTLQALQSIDQILTEDTSLDNREGQLDNDDKKISEVGVK